MITRADGKDWFEGPEFSYWLNQPGDHRLRLKVFVPASSWPLRGVKLSTPVVKLIRKAKKRGCHRVLDFGAGSWLRYSDHLCSALPDAEIVAAEYAEAFRDQAAAVRLTFQSRVTFKTPTEFARRKSPRFDLILLVNVLNTVPELQHREAMFQILAKRLNPLGWVGVYQRIWASLENPAGALEYGDGWFVRQPHDDHYTFRARTGYHWFSSQATAAGLRQVDTGIPVTSSNTIFRVWERPF